MMRPLVLACVLASACGSGGGPIPTAPTQEPFRLPAGAPPDAAARAGTKRITITTIELIGPDGARVAPDKLKAVAPPVAYKMRVWIFCPAGLEGPQGSGWNAETLEFSIRKSDPVTSSGGSFSGPLKLDAGYSVLEEVLIASPQPGQQRVATEISRNFAVIARNEFVATFSE